MSTRGKIENSEKFSFSDLTFKKMFYETSQKYEHFWDNLNTELTYTFELVGPENRIVTVYPERKLYLLSGRNRNTLEELSFQEIYKQKELLNIETPNKTKFETKDNIFELAKKLRTLEEGYVLVDYSKKDIDNISYKRVKVKNPAYVAIHHLKDSAGKSLRSIFRLVSNNDEEEFLTYFPEFKNYVIEIKQKYIDYVKEVKKEEKEIEHLFLQDHTNKEIKKQFALLIKDKKESAYFFSRFYKRNNSYEEHNQKLEKEKGSKFFDKFWVEKLNLRDVEFSSNE
jgi:hypothetical protein